MQGNLLKAIEINGDDQKCLNAGMDGYVSRPISAKTLFAEIDRIMNQSDEAW